MCDKCSKKGLYTSVKCSYALCVLWKNKFTDLLNKFKLIIFCFIAVFSFSFYIEMTEIAVTFGGYLLKHAVTGTLTVQHNWNFALFYNVLCELCCDDTVPAL